MADWIGVDMATVTTTRCDGCRCELKPGSFFHAITGKRANGAGGGGMPDADFDWCTDCAQVAFGAVKERRAALT